MCVECIKKIDAIRQKRKELNKEMEAAIKAELPLGTTVEYKHGRNYIRAEVIYVNAFSENVKVRGATGREYWLDVARIEAAWRD